MGDALDFGALSCVELCREVCGHLAMHFKGNIAACVALIVFIVHLAIALPFMLHLPPPHPASRGLVVKPPVEVDSGRESSTDLGL